MKRKKTGLIYHKTYLEHEPGAFHPESPARLISIMEYLSEIQLIDKLELISPSPAEHQWISTIHTDEYINFIKYSCAHKNFQLDADTIICQNSYDVACLAVGGVLNAADAIMSGKIENAFCAVRPPGHHAECNRAMGFCIFNNVAIVAKYLQEKYGLTKILIIDWDVHHGNGTQNSFYQDSSVFYFSIHQFPFYPGTGRIEETGDEEGLGYNLNIPVKAGNGDEKYIKIFKNQLLPVVYMFKPDFILISTGFDAHYQDPLSAMQVTDEGFKKMTEIICEIADIFCNGRIISILEGGYNLQTLPKSIATHIKILKNGESDE